MTLTYKVLLLPECISIIVSLKNRSLPSTSNLSGQSVDTPQQGW